MSEADLKPCPFCGAPASIGRRDDYNKVVAECVACDAMIAGDSHDEVRAAWDLRHGIANGGLAMDPSPRRTLVDVVRNPPKGWTCRGFYLDGSVRFDHSGATVWKAKDKWPESKITIQEPRAQAAAHRDVADLLDLLAEVSDV